MECVSYNSGTKIGCEKSVEEDAHIIFLASFLQQTLPWEATRLSQNHCEQHDRRTNLCAESVASGT